MQKINGYVIYDLETSGLNTRFDIPVQFAAVCTDTDLNIVDETEFRGRLPAHVLPAAGALIATNRHFSEIQSSSLSFYQFMRKIESIISVRPASCCVAHNGIRFDEEMLRHSFYQTLQQPYLTQFNGNRRADSLRLLHAVHILQPGNIVVPVGDGGKPTFKLDRLAPANGIVGHQAHDALGDVRATTEVLRLVRNKVPHLWSKSAVWSDKSAVADMLATNSVVLQAEWYGKPSIRSLHPLGPNPNYPTEWYLVDLRLNPASYVTKSPKELAAILQGRISPKPIAKIKTNGMPIVLAGDDPLAKELHPVDDETRKSRSAIIDQTPDLLDRVAQAYVLQAEKYAASEHIEDGLYSGGFFPTSEDSALINSFHVVEPAMRVHYVEKFKDPRAKELARRLIFNEWADHMTQAERTVMAAEVHKRLTHVGDVPWMTVQKALTEIAELLPACNGKAAVILSEYRQYLFELNGLAAAE